MECDGRRYDWVLAAGAKYWVRTECTCKYPAVDWVRAREPIFFCKLNDLGEYLDESEEALTPEGLIKLLDCCKQLPAKRYLACLEWAYLNFDPVWSHRPITIENSHDD